MTVAKLSGVVHVRPVSISGEVFLTQYGGLSLAYAVHKNGDVSVAVAACSDEDQFNRREGRSLAVERLQTRATLIESSVVEFLAKEAFGETRKIKPIEAVTGEYYVPTNSFPLVNTLLVAARGEVTALVARSLRRQGAVLPDTYSDDWVHFTRVNGKYGFFVTPEAPAIGEPII